MYRLLRGEFHAFTEAQLRERERRSDETDEGYARRVEMIQPTKYMAIERLKGWFVRNSLVKDGICYLPDGTIFNWDAYRGDLIESEEDLCARYNLQNERGESQRQQECVIEGIKFDFRKFARVGELEARGSPLDRKAGEGDADYVVRLQKIVDELKASQQSQSGTKPGGGESAPAFVTDPKLNPPDLDKMPLKQLLDLAAEEEIDVKGSKDRNDVLKTIKVAKGIK